MPRETPWPTPYRVKPPPLKHVKEIDTSWMDDTRRRCLDLGPSMFYPDNNDFDDCQTAKSNCDGCPVKARCLHYAVEFPERFGVWGGASEKQRRQIRKSRHKRLITQAGAEIEAQLEDEGKV